MENYALKSVMKAAVEASYQADLKHFRVVDLEVGTIMLGVGLTTAVSLSIFKEDDLVDLSPRNKMEVYQATVPDGLMLDATNSPMYLLMSNNPQVHYQKFLESFKKHFNSQSEADIYMYSFEKLAKALAHLQYKKAFVDVDTSNRRLDFYLNIGHKMLLTVSQVAKDIDEDEVMFSLEQNHETIVMDRIFLPELVGKIQKIQISFSQA